MTTDELDTIRHASRFDGATFNAGTARALLAELDAARAREQALARTIDRAWAMIENCYDVESRAECEASDLTHDGFLPIEMAIHAIGKRDPKVAELVAREAKLREALTKLAREALVVVGFAQAWTPLSAGDIADLRRAGEQARAALAEGEATRG